MSLETAQYIHQLSASNPSGADRLKDGDDHLRMIKRTLLNTFPGITGPLNASVTHTLLNSVAALLVPIGAIVLWSGAEADVPAGWAICDGRTVTSSDGSRTFATPNMVDRAPIGVSSTRAVNTAHGSASKTITTEAAGGHSHTGSSSAAGLHSHSGVTASTTLSEAQMPRHRHFVAIAGNAGSTTISAATAIGVEKTSDGDSGYRLVGTAAEPNAGYTSSVGSGAGHDHGISADGSHTHGITVDGVAGHSHAATVDVTQPSYAVYFIMKI